MTFTLEKFEYLCYRRDHEMAIRELINLLGELDRNFGRWGSEFKAQALSAVLQQEVDQHLLTRLTSAISCLISDRRVHFSPEWYTRILTMHRWISGIFAASPFRNADHLLRSLNLQGAEKLREVSLDNEDVAKFCLFYTSESEVRLDLDALWAFDKKLAVGLCISLLSPRFLASSAAHGKREAILPWLTRKLPLIDDVDDLPYGVLHDVYMHCSYADRTDKHDVKRSINTLIERKFHQVGLLPRQRPVSLGDGKAVLLVVLEWFTSGHSIYRTHSRTMEAARELFHVIAMGYANCVDEVTRKVFDEFHAIDAGGIVKQMQQIQKLAEDRNAQILYMPSVGMFPLTMYLANLRVAPLQCMALGHPATTHAKAIDYVVVEEDFVGDPACFSEQLLRLPFDAMPYRPSAFAAGLPPLPPRRQQPEVVEIALCSTIMKLNPGFLQVCADIVERSPVKIHFRFLIGQAQGLIYPQVQRVVQQFLGDTATVVPHQGYEQYMVAIANCDMFINPFPFGNTNGIIDTVSAGLVGVCKTGPEVHEHIDEGLFRRLGLPHWLITSTNSEYVNAVVRLAANHDERNHLRTKFAGIDKVQIFFSGRPDIMGQYFMTQLQELAL